MKDGNAGMYILYVASNKSTLETFLDYKLQANFEEDCYIPLMLFIVLRNIVELFQTLREALSRRSEQGGFSKNC